MSDSFASFGAVRPCGAHRQAAVRCASALRGAAQTDTPRAAASRELGLLPFASAVCYGHGLAGDFGSSQLQRYSKAPEGLELGNGFSPCRSFLPRFNRVVESW